MALTCIYHLTERRTGERRPLIHLQKNKSVSHRQPLKEYLLHQTYDDQAWQSLFDPEAYETSVCLQMCTGNGCSHNQMYQLNYQDLKTEQNKPDVKILLGLFNNRIKPVDFLYLLLDM